MGQTPRIYEVHPSLNEGTEFKIPGVEGEARRKLIAYESLPLAVRDGT